MNYTVLSSLLDFMQIGPLDTESLFTEIRALNIKTNIFQVQ